jgi:hypothetical protein
MTEEILLAIGRLEGKVDAMLGMVRMQEEQLRMHDERIRELEHSKAFLMGIAALAGGATSTGVTLILKHFGNH